MRNYIRHNRLFIGSLKAVVICASLLAVVFPGFARTDSSLDEFLIRYCFKAPIPGGQGDFVLLNLVKNNDQHEVVASVKYQVAGKTIYPAGEDDRNAFKAALLGESGEVVPKIKEVQSAFGASDDGAWGNGTWRALRNNSQNMDLQSFLAGKKRIGFIDVDKADLSQNGKDLLARLENDNERPSKMDQALIDGIVKAVNGLPFPDYRLLNNTGSTSSTSSTTTEPTTSTTTTSSTTSSTKATTATTTIATNAAAPDQWLIRYAFQTDMYPAGKGNFVILNLVSNDQTNRVVSSVKFQISGNKIWGHQSARDYFKQALLGDRHWGDPLVIKEFQRALGATEDGSWGNATWIALAADSHNLAGKKLKMDDRVVGVIDIDPQRLSDSGRTLLSRMENGNEMPVELPKELVNQIVLQASRGLSVGDAPGTLIVLTKPSGTPLTSTTTTSPTTSTTSVTTSLITSTAASTTVVANRSGIAKNQATNSASSKIKSLSGVNSIMQIATMVLISLLTALIIFLLINQRKTNEILSSFDKEGDKKLFFEKADALLREIQYLKTECQGIHRSVKTNAEELKEQTSRQGWEIQSGLEDAPDKVQDVIRSYLDSHLKDQAKQSAAVLEQVSSIAKNTLLFPQFLNDLKSLNQNIQELMMEHLIGDEQHSYFEELLNRIDLVRKEVKTQKEEAPERGPSSIRETPEEDRKEKSSHFGPIF